MTQLRHIQLGRMILSEPPSAEIEAENSVIVLENLQTLSIAIDFRSTEEILKRISNLKKLGIGYEYGLMNLEYFYLNNLVRLHQLESLKCLFFESSPSFLHNIIILPQLKKLTLGGIFIPWKDMTIIGSLPNLEVLKLKRFAFDGPEWEPNEGEFLQLKYLLLENIHLLHWRADSIHFPSLQRLVLKNCYKMEEIPSGVGEILTLQMIELHYCAFSLVTSAKQIQEEQQSFGNDGLQVLIWG
ncbi:putative late blight resistance protein-like protein R1A-6 [Forsythia ovata]|uniref:Late blight resistance protein-like protein R1A-6 n=1 Tax=Forsythia ovata TaxID=205694 RepID=A0ABD1QUL1_9LAMI